jgi:DNA (cytosine-5)-methyltransferase 1
MTISVLDLFAGCGGLSLGLQQAGFRIVAAIESDKWAADTYQHNHRGVEVARSDIRALDSDFLAQTYRGQIDLVVGGPPCQGFSVSGKRQYGVFLEKNQLVHEYIRVVEAVRPSMFLLENVRGFATANIDGQKKALGTVLQELTSLGYHLHSAVLQAAEFGVPQYRSRLFVVGSKRELRGSPFPEATHAPAESPLRKAQLSLLESRPATRAAQEVAARREFQLSVLDAISDLPEIEAGGGTDGPQPYTKKASSAFQNSMRAGASAVFNHEAMKHTRRLVERFSSIKPGGSAYKMGLAGNTPAVTVYKSNNQRLIESLPSLCITANFQSNYVHPLLNRNLTAREAARIQTFPDTFVIQGRRTLMSSTLLSIEGRHDENHLSQYNQLGNAVPPLLAKAIALRLAEVLPSRWRSSGDEAA